MASPDELTEWPQRPSDADDLGLSADRYDLNTRSLKGDQVAPVPSQGGTGFVFPGPAGLPFSSVPGVQGDRVPFRAAFDLDECDDGPPLSHYDEPAGHHYQDTFPIEPADDEWSDAALKWRRSEAASPRLPVQLETRGATRHAEFWRERDLHLASIISKLRHAGRHDLASPLDECGLRETVQMCTGCRRTTRYYNRCDIRHCPRCAPRLARERRDEIEWWAKLITQGKHVVLTARNTDDLTRETVQRFKSAWGKLRRRAFADGWRGGCYTLEITNEGRGWHLHLHALIDARWIDARQLAIEWASCLGQATAIVKVKDARDSEYLAEIAKYVVKGSELAGWTGDEIARFVDAFSGLRTFGTFGTLYKRRAEWRTFVDGLQHPEQVCHCGCTTFKHMSPTEFEAWTAINGPPSPSVHTSPAPKAPKTPAQSEFFPLGVGSPSPSPNWNALFR